MSHEIEENYFIKAYTEFPLLTSKADVVKFLSSKYDCLFAIEENSGISAFLVKIHREHHDSLNKDWIRYAPANVYLILEHYPWWEAAFDLICAVLSWRKNEYSRH